MRTSAAPSPLKDALWYTAAAAGVLTPATAGAQIVYQDVDPDLVVQDTDTSGDGVTTGIPFDLDGDGDAEILFAERIGNNYTYFAWDTDPSDGPDAITGVLGSLFPFGGNNYAYPFPLSAGALIGPGPDLITGYSIATFEFAGSDPLNWYGTDAYVGIQFTLDGSATHYGWLRVEIPDGGGQIIFKEFAYESSPDTPIEAGATGVAIEPGPDGAPGTHALSEAAPNPFTGRAALTLEVAETQAVRIVVYDALGREVASLHAGPLAAGRDHTLTLDPAALGLQAGVYLVRVAGEHFSETRSVTFVR